MGKRVGREICFLGAKQKNGINQLNQSFNDSFIHSFVHSLIRSFLHSFIHSFVRSFMHSCVHSLLAFMATDFCSFLGHPMATAFGGQRLATDFSMQNDRDTAEMPPRQGVKIPSSIYFRTIRYIIIYLNLEIYGYGILIYRSTIFLNLCQVPLPINL